MRLLVVFLVFSSLINNALPQNTTDEYIFPDVNRKFVIVSATSSGQRNLTGRELPSTDSLAELALTDIRQAFNWQMIRMSQCARNFTKNTEGPNILLVSRNEGGFPRTGVTDYLTAFNEGGGKADHPRPYQSGAGFFSFGKHDDQEFQSLGRDESPGIFRQPVYGVNG